jgi:hypothetical protein
MSVTTRIAQDRLKQYFETFTKRFLQDGSPEAVDIEVLEPELGGQHAARGALLIGITYDPRISALELEVDSGDHRVYAPEAVWALEEADGFISALEVVAPDGTREVVSIKRVGLRPME